MQPKLEEVLKDKERELKLHQRFLDLRHLCEEDIFPSIDLPLRQHTEDLKALIEQIIPDPKDRTEEMFSGEIFTLLGMIYLHDVGIAKDYEVDSGKRPFSNLDGTDKRMFLNDAIGEKLGIPETAIEIINYLTFSSQLKKIPSEWEITEEGKKAIIRSTRILTHVFNFSHLLLDIFYTDLMHKKLRRFHDRNFILKKSEAEIDIGSREGIIRIAYKARFPYELHLLEQARGYVEASFAVFKNNVNGKLGFNYRDIVWDITNAFSYERDPLDQPRLSAYEEFEGPPYERWEKASKILDKVLNFGSCISVGDLATGKTTVMRSFVIPQLLSVSPNVFYCELWERPVSEIKDIICKRRGQPGDTELDIISLCTRLLHEGSCFFILDNYERYTHLDVNEQEKLDRFITFCLEHENVYLIISGDKETFFEWYTPFSTMSMSAICEIKPLEGAKVIDTYGGECPWDTNERYKPIECELLRANTNPDTMLADILKSVKEEDSFRKIVATFVDGTEQHVKRLTMEDLFFETAVPHKKINGYLTFLKEKDILKEFESMGQVYYCLTSRYLEEPLYRVLGLGDFEEKKKIRNILQNSVVNETPLDAAALGLFEKWEHDMIFSKEEMGVILASLILEAKDYGPFYENAKQYDRGADIQPILRLLSLDDPEKRKKAVELLIEIRDKDMINPLLAHLKKEDVFEIKDLLIRGIALTGKKRTILAVMDALKAAGDRPLKLKAIEFFYSLLDGNVEKVLTEIRDTEEDPLILMKIDSMLSTIRET